MRQSRRTTELALVVEALPEAEQRLSAALGAARVSCVLISRPTSWSSAPAPPFMVEHARSLLELARSRGITALIVDDARLARTLRADGVHLSRAGGTLASYSEAREIVGRGSLVGVEPGPSRHDAMELAEAGADYAAFGRDDVEDREEAECDPQAAREAWLERLAWWVEIFQVPCLALGIETRADAFDVGATGAEYAAVTLRSGERLDAIAAHVAALEAALAGSQGDEGGGGR